MFRQAAGVCARGAAPQRGHGAAGGARPGLLGPGQYSTVQYSTVQYSTVQLEVLALVSLVHVRLSNMQQQQSNMYCQLLLALSDKYQG